MIQLLKLTILLTLFSCASHQTGNTSTGDIAKKKDVIVTAKRIHEYSTSYFTLIEIQYKNQTADWIDIENTNLVMGEDDLKVVLGRRLKEWAMAIKDKVAIDRYNDQVIYGSLIAATAIASVASASSGDINTSSAFYGGTMGLTTAASLNDLSKKVSDLERAKIIPDTHFYSKTSLAPGLVTKRWILLQHNNGAYVNNLAFKINLKGEDKRKYSIRL